MPRVDVLPDQELPTTVTDRRVDAPKVLPKTTE